MDIDANLEILMAAVAPPPGHHREVGEGEPAGALVVEMQADWHRKPPRTAIDQLEDTALTTAGETPAGVPPDRSMNQRLVAADETLGGAITEAVAQPDTWPFAAVGRVTAVFNGKVRHCTGTVIAERVVLTVGHCAYSRSDALIGERGFADWVLFQPQYKAGTSAGRWAGEAIYTLSGWTDAAPGSNVGSYDLAMIRLDAPIAAQTGTAPLLMNTSPDGPFTSVGYPRQPGSGFAFDGRFLFASTGERIDDGSAHLIKAENGLTEGSSGGPWFTREAGGLHIAGVNSTKPMDSDAYTWSPLFGTGFQKLLARVLADMTGV